MFFAIQKVIQFIDQQKVAKFWLSVEINFSIQDSA